MELKLILLKLVKNLEILKKNSQKPVVSLYLQADLTFLFVFCIKIRGLGLFFNIYQELAFLITRSSITTPVTIIIKVTLSWLNVEKNVKYLKLIIVMKKNNVYILF